MNGLGPTEQSYIPILGLYSQTSLIFVMVQVSGQIPAAAISRIYNILNLSHEKFNELIRAKQIGKFVVVVCYGHIFTVVI